MLAANGRSPLAGRVRASRRANAQAAGDEFALLGNLPKEEFAYQAGGI